MQNDQIRHGNTYTYGHSIYFLDFTKDGIWGRKSPSAVQGQSPGRGLGDKVPQKLTFLDSKVFLRKICQQFHILT